MTEPAKNLFLFHAVILHADGTFATETFVTIDELKTRLVDLMNRDVSVSCFRGERLHISKPPMRYLMTSDGNIPLFAAEQTIEPDETGYLGVDPANFEDPPQLSPPRNESNEQDQFFSDDDGDAINIFDSALPDPDA